MNGNTEGNLKVINSSYVDLLTMVKYSEPLPVSLYHESYTAQKFTSHAPIINIFVFLFSIDDILCHMKRFVEKQCCNCLYSKKQKKICFPFN